MTQVVHAPLKAYSVSLFTDNSHRFCPLGYRLSVIRWKETTDKITGTKKAAKSAVCVPVPVVAFEIEPAVLGESVKEHFSVQQDLIVRGQIDSWFQSHENVLLGEVVIDPFSLSAEGLARFSLNSQIGAKLSAELIGEWFSASLEPVLTEKFSSLASATPEMVQRAVKQHREILEKLASPKAVLSANIAQQMLKVVGFSEDDSFVKGSIVRKLNTYLMSDTELLMSL